MTTLRCSQKLLKRLRQPAQLPEPLPSTNPLGEWCADIDFIDRASGGGRYGYHTAPDLLRKHLLPSAKILPFAVPATRR